MEDKPVDRSFIVPILIGVFSIAGILAVLLALRYSANRPVNGALPTSTPLRYQFLATEPGVVTLAPLGTPTKLLAPTEFSLVIEDATPTSEFIEFFTPTGSTGGNRNPTITPTPTYLPIGRTYDDTDFALNYTGNWVAQSGVNGVFQNTLHLSNTIGSAVQLSFIGQKIRVVYQAGPSLGIVAIRLDTVDFTLNQESDETQQGEWESPLLILSSHTLTITHVAGGSINIDSIVILDTATATPTLTSTP